MPDPYFSELKYLGGASLDFVEVAVDQGTDISDLQITVYFADGTIRSTNTLVGITPTTVAGKDVYLIDTNSSGTFTGLALSNGISLSDNGSGTVYSFLSFTDTAAPVTATEGPASGLTSTEIGSAGFGSSLESNDGASYTLQTNPTPGSIPCFVKGTQIALPNGLSAPIEDLREGDLVFTANNGPSKIKWIGRRALSNLHLQENPKLYPVRIAAGSLGNGLPKNDLLVSRQHRMLLHSQIAKRMFGQSEVLVAAIKLTGLSGVFLDDSADSVEYYHLLLDKHEIVYANGAPTESLFLGPEAIGSIDSKARAEILSIFPEADRLSHAPTPAALIPCGKSQKLLIARHLKNSKPCLCFADKEASRHAEDVLQADSRGGK